MAKIIEQLKIQVADQIGKLSEISDALKSAGVNIIAANAWVNQGQGFIYLVAENTDEASAAVGPIVDSCEAGGKVVCMNVPDKPGALGEIATKLADAGIGINLCYATTAGGEAMIVLDTTDNEKAAGLI